jgi:hypothetical protein
MEEMSNRVVTYSDRVTPVQLGDHVETRVWWQKRRGRVVYVPGISPVNAEMERDGLTWVGIRLDGEEGFVSTLVDPEGLFLVKKEKFLQRDPEGFTPLGPEEDPHGPDDFLAP